ncbi:hypothetical protein [Paractinoplanes lichenicola]|uniref:SRPBCC domain-containing protein n=1 Tax=Paractinoplanes lichenicola TaxID=2802976 RepID=A0ABS1VM41_9ACTN|nr:hypothetical protein [Actinoplanes lichenicola]MBL7255723.1 hypothetical protein [Actinoplanes lichenicola]
MAANSRIKPVEKATNRTWDEWLTFMDGIGAKDLDHKQIALKVYYELEGTGVEPLGWWTQAVTVAYEQFIGRRIPGQRPDGTFQMSVSRSTTMGMQELMNAWAAFAPTDEFVTGLLAEGASPKISGTDRRITWRIKAADDSQIIVTSEPKANGTASIVAAQLGLQTPELNDQARDGWAGAVERFLGGAQAE